MANLSLILASILLMGLISISSAYDFYVGGKAGWTQNPQESYNTWAGRMRFQINDKLVFKYDKSQDSILVVKKEDYDSCNTKNPIQKLEGGNSIFSFTRSGPFYFISGASDRCSKGEKLIVVVMADRTKKPLPSPSAAPSPSKPPSSSPSPSLNPPSKSPSSSPSPSPVGNSPTKSPLSSPSPSPVGNSPTKSPISSPSPSPVGNSPTKSPLSSPSPSPIENSPVQAPTISSSPPPAGGVSPVGAPGSSDGGNEAEESPISSPKPANSMSSDLTVSRVSFVMAALVLGIVVVG